MCDDRSPSHRQIADQISSDVLSGALAAHEQALSTKQCASFYRINPATAAEGFQLLVDEEILDKRRGLGLFVAPDAWPTLQKRHRKRFYTDVIDPMMKEAEASGISRDDIITYIASAAHEEPS